MAGAKRWTPQEDALMMEIYNEIKCDHPDASDNLIFEQIADDVRFPKWRNEKGIEQRFYRIKNAESKPVDPKPKTEQQHDPHKLLDGIVQVLEAYQKYKDENATLKAENAALKKRIAELEQNQHDLDALTKIIERARNLVLTEEAPTEKPRFKMDNNGNLERL